MGRSAPDQYEDPIDRFGTLRPQVDSSSSDLNRMIDPLLRTKTDEELAEMFSALSAEDFAALRAAFGNRSSGK